MSTWPPTQSNKPYQLQRMSTPNPGGSGNYMLLRAVPSNRLQNFNPYNNGGLVNEEKVENTPNPNTFPQFSPELYPEASQQTLNGGVRFSQNSTSQPQPGFGAIQQSPATTSFPMAPPMQYQNQYLAQNSTNEAPVGYHTVKLIRRVCGSVNPCQQRKGVYQGVGNSSNCCGRHICKPMSLVLTKYGKTKKGPNQCNPPGYSSFRNQVNCNCAQMQAASLPKPKCQYRIVSQPRVRDSGNKQEKFYVICSNRNGNKSAQAACLTDQAPAKKLVDCSVGGNTQDRGTESCFDNNPWAAYSGFGFPGFGFMPSMPFYNDGFDQRRSKSCEDCDKCDSCESFERWLQKCESRKEHERRRQDNSTDPKPTDASTSSNMNIGTEAKSVSVNTSSDQTEIDAKTSPSKESTKTKKSKKGKNEKKDNKDKTGKSKKSRKNKK